MLSAGFYYPSLEPENTLGKRVHQCRGHQSLARRDSAVTGCEKRGTSWPHPLVLSDCPPIKTAQTGAFYLR
ncbi:hypothetical protein LEMLEM_LOCUS1851 [Lemmus lemmus]